jgi:transposase
MTFREVTMLEIKEVLRHWLRGQSKSEIARWCGVSRATVGSYIKAAEGCGLSLGHSAGETALSDEVLAELAGKLHPESGRPHGDGWQVCEENRQYIAGHLADGVSLAKIRKLLRRQRGVQVSYATLWRFATAELGFGAGETTVLLEDGGPGKELQVDTGWVGRLSPDLCGRRRRFRAWIFTPVVSRYRFVYPVFRETTQTAIEACEAAWRFYGGVFDVLIPDNTKTIVEKPDPLRPTFNKTFLEYSQTRDFVIDPTRVRKPKDKARVENAVRSVKRDCFDGERLLDLDHCRAHALHWYREEYGMTRHRTTRRLPREHFEAVERAHLHPEPSEEYDVPLWCTPKVHRDQHAQVAASLYSLPPQFKGRRLQARADRTTVRFYEFDQLVKMHPRVGPGQRHTDPADFPPEKMAYALRDVAFLVRKASEHGDAVGRYASALLDSRLPWTRMRQVYALINLAKRYGSARLEQACATALSVELIDVYRLRRLLELAPPVSKPLTAGNASKVAAIARFLRPAKQFALPLTPSLPKKDDDPKGENQA